MFTKKQLKELFPFHILIKEDLSIAQCGNALSKLITYDLTGQSLTEHFTVAGLTGELNFDTFLKKSDKLIYLESIKENLALKGAFYASAHSDHLIFIGNIQPDHFLKHHKNKVTLKDFPAYYSFNDFLFSYRANTMAQNELQTILSGSKKQLKEIQTLNEELLDSESRHRNLLETMNEGVLQVDNNEIIEYVNNQFCELLGYTKEELIGQNANKLLSGSEEEGRAMKKKVKERRKGISGRYELKVRKKDGEIIWLAASGAPVFDEKRKVIGSIGINTDITQRKKDEINMEVLSRFPSENPFPVLRYSIEKGNFIYHNNSGRSIIELLNIKKNNALKKHWESQIETAYKTKESLQEEIHIKDVVFMCNIVPISKSNYVNIYANDITEARKAGEALQESEEKYRTLVEKMSEGVILLNVKDQIEYVNTSFCEILGYAKDQLIGNSSIEILNIDKDSLKEIKRSVTKRNKRGSSKYELKYKHKSGDWIWVSISGTRLLDDKGKTAGSMGIVTDITNQKRFEDEINELNTGLEIRVEQRTNELEKANSEIRLLLQEMHHRVKNNLQIISSLLNMQASKMKDELVVRAFRASQDRIQTMAFIHENLYMNELLSEISIIKYLEPLVKYRIRANAKSENIQLETNFLDINLTIDTMLPIGLLINEMVTNSIKHAFPNNEDGKITVSILKGKKNKLVLRYSDNGIGFPQDHAIDTSSSLGLILIDTLSVQLEGELKRSNKKGTHYEIVFEPR